MSECPLPASFATPPQALEMLTRLQQESVGNACHGLVTISLKPNATLLRLTPENTARLHEEISLRLTQALREQDTLYALGVWEWLAVLPHLPSPASVSFAMLKLHRIFQQSPPRIEGQEASLQPVCGSAICPDHGDDPQHLLQSARIAALYACQQGEWMAIYQPDMERGGQESADLIRQLQSALLEDQLQLFLQPQINLNDSRCCHAEALLRWQRPNGDWADASHTIEILEQAGLRPHFNRWLFQRVALYLSRLRDAKQEIGLSINLSGKDLLDPEVPDLLAQALATWNLPTTNLTLEITETVAVQESHAVEAVLHRLRDMGVRLSIDDFGTGYAGMAYLQHLPVQEIKIDKRFIQRLAESARDQEITRSILELARKLGLQVVAEGVETPAALHCLRQMHCERIQGYLYSQALPLEEFLSWLTAHTARNPQGNSE